MNYKDQIKFKTVATNLTNAINKSLESSVAGNVNVKEVVLHDLRKGSVISNFTIIYHTVPYLEVLVVQNAIDNIHMIDTLRVEHINVSTQDVPNKAPNFTAVSSSPFAIDVVWSDVDNTTYKGDKYIYYVYYRLVEEKGEPNWKVVGTTGNNITLIDLKPGHLYGIRMSLSIKGGNGIASEEIETWTTEGPPYVKPPNVEYIIKDYQTVYISWDDIPKSEVPGILRGYEITYREYFGKEKITVQLPFNMQQRTITGLKADTLYWLEITGFSNGGSGPDQLIIFKTPAGPPTIPPPNVYKHDRYSTTKVTIGWDEIPEEEQAGSTEGYKVKYRLISKSGVDAPIGTLPEIITVDKHVFELEIKNLLPYAEYFVEIYGFANQGDGPASVMTVYTCACPEILYSNYIEIPPYVIVNKRNESDVTGFFPDLLNQILDQVCVHCKAYKPRIFYDRTELGYPSLKIRIHDMKINVNYGTHLNFPFFGAFEVEKFEGFFPYIGVVESQGVAIIVKDIKVKTLGMMQILNSISKAWSVLLIGVMMCFICGWLFWIFEQGSSKSQVSNKSLYGALQGLWLAYVTMTTVGYGDFVPTTNVSKVLMMIWVMVGLVTMGVVTGVISSGMTVDDVEKELKLYGTTTASMPDTFARQVAILRNAIVDESMNYSRPQDLFDAVVSGRTKIALLDAREAAYFEEKMKQMSLRASKIVDTNSGYGVVLSGGLEPLESDIRSFIASKQPQIIEYVKNNVLRLTPKYADPELELIPKSEVIDILTIMGYCFVGVLVFVFFLRLMQLKKRLSVKPIGPYTSNDLYKEVNDVVSGFNTRFTNNIKTLQSKHFSDTINLVRLHKNYQRLLLRTGFDKYAVEESFKKKRKKDVNAIIKRNRLKRFEATIMSQSRKGDAEFNFH